MAILIYLIVAVILLAVFLKMKEKSYLKPYTKNGEIIPHYTFYESLQRIISRFYIGIDAFTFFKSNVKEKGETFASFFLISKPRIVVT